MEKKKKPMYEREFYLKSESSGFLDGHLLQFTQGLDRKRKLSPFVRKYNNITKIRHKSMSKFIRGCMEYKDTIRFYYSATPFFTSRYSDSETCSQHIRILLV